MQQLKEERRDGEQWTKQNASLCSTWLPELELLQEVVILGASPSEPPLRGIL